jgi:hypothetical protein
MPAPGLSRRLTGEQAAFMFDNRSLRLDLCALALLGLVIFLSVALLSYEPADSVGQLVWPLDRLYAQDQLVYPPNARVENACGWWGAFAADLLLTNLGLISCYLVLSLAVLDGLLLARYPIEAPLLRCIGWLASLVGLATLATFLPPQLSPGPLSATGGNLGLLVRSLLELQFAMAGTLIVAVSLLCGGLMLSTDYAVFRLVAALARRAAVLPRAIRTPLAAAGRSTGTARANAAADAEKGDAESVDEMDEEGDSAPLAVKVRG